MRQMMSQQRLWNQLEGFTHQIHGSLDLKETAYAVANDGKRLVGCDRLSVALKIGGRMMVEAVSGQEVVEQRANLVRELTRLCKAVIRSGEDLVYTGNTEGFAPDIRDALEMYVDESGSKAVIVTLLHKPETEHGAESKEKEVPFGCLVAEQIGDELAPTDMHARTEVVSRHASTALWNAQEHDKIFLLPLLKAMGSPWRFFRGRTLAKIVGGARGAIVASILILTFVPWKLTIEGRGSLLPEERRITYAPVAGRSSSRSPSTTASSSRRATSSSSSRATSWRRSCKRLIAESAGRQTQVSYLDDPGQQGQSPAGDDDEIQPAPGPARTRRRSRPRAPQEQIEIIEEQLESMDDPRRRRTGSSRPGRPRRTCWAGRSRSAPSCSRSPRPRASGCWRSRSPTTTWGRSSGPRASSRRRSRPAEEAAGLDPAGLLRHGDRPRAPLPRLRPADRLEGRDWSRASTSSR